MIFENVMRAQGLPITTIVLIIIAIAVLAGVVLLFYFGWFKPQSSVGEQEMISKCQSLCAQIQAHNPKTKSDVTNYLDGFCSYKYNCSDYVTCRINTQTEGECIVSCTGNGIGSCS